MSSSSRPLQESRAAFSLVEILLALGLLAVVVTAVLALFPVAFKTERENEEETRAALISSGMMDTLTLDGNGGSLHLVSAMRNGLPIWQTLQLGINTNFTVAYDTSCEPMRSLSEAEAGAPIPDQTAAAVATLRLISNASLPGLLTAEVAVASPASAPEAGRTTRRFVRLISIP
jgi:type II secretory pathway pseudopilin PulG